MFAVPPLPRRADAKRSLDFDAAELVAKHIEQGGITRYLYGGNAFLYHITLDEYEMLLGWLDVFGETRWAIPSVGPSFGRAMDQAKLLRRHAFRTAMVLPCNDPRDARGMEAGLREIADAAGVPLILYLKSEDGFGSDKDAGLDAVGRLIDDGVAVAIRYAVVLEEPRRDPYLEGLLRRVDRHRVISGMGERPAIVHMRDFGLHGSPPVLAALLRAPAATCSTHAFGRTGPVRRISAPSSCRWRISGTPGVRRACCITRRSSPALRRPDQFPHTSLRLPRHSSSNLRRSRATFASATRSLCRRKRVKQQRFTPRQLGHSIRPSHPVPDGVPFVALN